MKGILGIFIFLILILSLSLGFFHSYNFPNVLPTDFTLYYIRETFPNITIIAHTIGIGLLNGILSTTIGFLVGYRVVRYKKLNTKYIIGFLQLPLFFPAISMFIGIQMILLRLNMNNSIMGVVLSHMFLSIPYGVNIGISFFENISENLEHISELLGGSKWITFKKVLFPLLKSGIALSLSLCFLISTSEYFATYLIGGGKLRTISGEMYPYIANFDLQNSSILMIIFLSINLIFFKIFNHRKLIT